MNTLTNNPFRRISNRLLLGMLVFPLVLSVHSQTREYIPLREQVGPELVTEEIAPVQAPFAMPEMKRPVFKRPHIFHRGNRCQTRENGY